MITTDKDGNLAWGEDEACVVYDYSSFTTGSKETQANPDDYSDFYTDYYFAIKDDIVFSDGTPLTIRDVLFNLYMYLDPVFSGSATLYSVNIKGLEEYRTQSGNAADQEGLEDTIRVRAVQAISDIIAWCDDSAAPLSALTETQQGYIDRAKEYFQEEMNSDWTAAETYAGEKNNDYKDRYGLHEAWEIFLYMYSPLGGITVTAKPNPGGNTTYEVQYNGWDNLMWRTSLLLSSLRVLPLALVGRSVLCSTRIPSMFLNGSSPFSSTISSKYLPRSAARM